MRLLRSRRPDADEILPGLLLGSRPTRRQRQTLHRRGVRFVLDLGEAVPGTGGEWPDEVVVRHSDVVHHPVSPFEQLDELAGWIVDLIRDGGRILVHGDRGLGLEATVGCAVLVWLGYDLPGAYRAVCDRRPVAAPTDAQIALLRRYERWLGGRTPVGLTAF